MFCCNPYRGRRKRENWSGTVRVKMVVVGDGQSGKTSLIQRHCSGTLPQSYTPTLFDTSTLNTLVEDRKVQMVIQDTAGQEDLSHLRPSCYLHADVIIVCFTHDQPDSLDRVRKYWVPEVRRYCGKRIPILLVANKVDEPASPKMRPKRPTQSLRLTPDNKLTAFPSFSDIPDYRNSDCCVYASKFDEFSFSDETSRPNSDGFLHPNWIRNESDSQRSSRDSGVFGSTEALVKPEPAQEKQSLLRRFSRTEKNSDTLCDKVTNSEKVCDSIAQCGRSLASQIGAVGYFQTSAVLNQGTEEVFHAALEAAMASKQWRKKYHA